ncbi:hypothetical protein F4774DRAFT_185633 [Daldinia eschscholtzii]|nr:hypothetical protein F4774DRAFT_185633 [Daldinia eschscholtzii]
MAELALGVIPLCVATFKGLVQLKSKLKVFRNYHQESRQLRMKLDIETELFRSELSHLLLRWFDPRLVAAMVSDLNHPQWQASDLEEKIKLHMGTKYNLFQQVIQELNGIMDNLDTKLSSFPLPDEESSKSTLKAFKLAFRKSEYTRSLDDLKDWTRMLTRLRETPHDLQDYAAVALSPPSITTLPAQYEAIRSICSQLHDLLQTRASCDASDKARHAARLLISPMEEREPNVNLFFEHTTVKGTINQRKLFPIQASCKGVGCSSTVSSSPIISCNICLSSSWRCTHNRDARVQIPTTCSTIDDTKHGDNDDGEDLTLHMIQCKELIQGPSIALQRSIGYLKLTDNRRLVLHRGIKELKINCNSLHVQETKPLVHFLDFPSEHVITDKNRIKLGLTLVKSMLKHHSTAWWPQESVLKYVYAFCDGTGELSSSLDTLHLSAQLETIRSTVDPATRSCIIQDESLAPNFLPLKRVEEAMQMYGIRNLTLYNLGVDLLQIGLWEHVAWEGEVEEIRSKVARLSHLGKKYRDAAKRLIDCDFGLASEQLEDTRLREAIFSSIVSDLEELLHQLTISGL